jgi:hypothetical protein
LPFLNNFGNIYEIRKGDKEMRYTTNERVAGVLPVGEKRRWEKFAEADGFHSLWTWVAWVVRKHIKENGEKDVR